MMAHEDDLIVFYRDVAPHMLAVNGLAPERAGEIIFDPCPVCHQRVSPTIRRVISLLVGWVVPPLKDESFARELGAATRFSFQQWRDGMMLLEFGHK